MQDTQLQPLLFNPLDPAFRIDPYPVYERLRREAPVYEPPFGGLVLSRHADCEAFLKDPRSSSDFRNSNVFAQLIAQNPDASRRRASSRRRGPSCSWIRPTTHGCAAW